jgi:hypothetical protein
MKFWPMVCTVAVAALAFSLARALATHDGVGPFEYATGIVLVALLAFGTLRVARHAVRR